MRKSPHWPGIGRYIGLLIDQSLFTDNRPVFLRGFAGLPDESDKEENKPGFLDSPFEKYGYYDWDK